MIKKNCKLLLGLIVILPIAACGSVTFTAKKESYMIPVRQSTTTIDKAIVPLIEEHPTQTGLLLLDDNLDAFAMRALTAREAGRSLDLQYYIWHDDLTGRLLGYELLRAADRGVRVRLLLDDMNVRDKDTVLATLEQHPNIEVRVFNPIYTRKGIFVRSLELVFRGMSLNRRMHNKAWIADGRIAIVGGRNIGNEYFNASHNTNFFDVDLLLTGNAVLETENIFDAFWNSPATVPLTKLVKANVNALGELRNYVENLDNNVIKETNVYIEQVKRSPSLYALFNGKRPFSWTANAHVYSDPPEKAYDLNNDKWLINTLYPVWTTAQHELKMISPYFVPGKQGLALLSRLRQRGVAINILTNSLAATDVMLVHSGYAPYRKPLLEENVQLYELMPYSKVKKTMLGSSGASLHTKAFMVDEKISFVGSFNLDPRSARLNTEMGVLFDQKQITQELLALYDRKIETTSSYKLYLDNGSLRWSDGTITPPEIWEHDPETGVFRRTITKIASWLPIESQL